MPVTPPPSRDVPRRARPGMAQVEHRGVGGEQVERCRPRPRPPRQAPRPRSDAPPPGSPGWPGVLEPQRHLGGARAGGDRRARAAGANSSKSTSQIHDTSRPSAIRSFSASSTRLGSPSRSACGPPRCPRRVLDQHQHRVAAVQVEPLEPAEGRRSNRSSPSHDPLQRDDTRAHAPMRPRPARCRRCRGRAPAAAPARSPAGVHQLEPAGLETLDLRPRVAATSGRGRACAAVGAAPVAQMAQVHRRVVEALAAAQAHHLESEACCIPAQCRPPGRRCRSR